MVQAKVAAFPVERVQVTDKTAGEADTVSLDGREKVVVISKAGSTSLMAEALPVEGIHAKGFRFFWVKGTLDGIEFDDTETVEDIMRPVLIQDGIPAMLAFVVRVLEAESTWPVAAVAHEIIAPSSLLANYEF